MGKGNFVSNSHHNLVYMTAVSSQPRTMLWRLRFGTLLTRARLRRETVLKWTLRMWYVVFIYYTMLSSIYFSNNLSLLFCEAHLLPKKSWNGNSWAYIMDKCRFFRFFSKIDLIFAELNSTLKTHSKWYITWLFSEFKKVL